MYEPPINVFFENKLKEIVEKQDAYIVHEVQRMCVNVDKEELIRALQYERGQYEKGYEDAFDDAQAAYIELLERYDKVVTEFHELRDAFVDYICSGIPNPSPFCKNQCADCVDSYGWCKWNDKCKGFNPTEYIIE